MWRVNRVQQPRFHPLLCLNLTSLRLDTNVCSVLTFLQVHDCHYFFHRFLLSASLKVLPSSLWDSRKSNAMWSCISSHFEGSLSKMKIVFWQNLKPSKGTCRQISHPIIAFSEILCLWSQVLSIDWPLLNRSILHYLCFSVDQLWCHFLSWEWIKVLGIARSLTQYTEILA